MTFIEHIEKFLGPVSTLFAAVVAATIAAKFAKRQAQASEMQAKIARDKLKLDAIEQRIDVMEATQDLILYTTNLKFQEAIDHNKINELRNRTLKGRFLFSKPVYLHILETINKCFDIAGYTEAFRSNERMDPNAGQAYIFKSNRRMDPSNITTFEQFKEKISVVMERAKLPEILEKDIALELFDEKNQLAQIKVNYTRWIDRACYVSMALIVFIFFIAAIAINQSR